MNNISFRIFNPVTLKFIYSGSTPTMLSGYFERTATLITLHNMKHQQNTNLLDNNGKEIYEGDLVKKHGQDSPIYQVVWSENAVGFALELEGPPHNNEWPGFLELEVVGNIWENGELINEPK